MGETRTPVVPEDIYRLDWLEDPKLSPDGRWVAYVHVAVDKARNRYRRAVWLAAADGSSPPRPFTSGQGNDHSPRWSPDGTRLAFVSDRDGDRDQLYVLRVDGGEGRPVTAMPNGVRFPAWSPDGTHLAFVARVSPDEREREARGEALRPPTDKWAAEHERVEDKRRRDEADDPRVTTRLPYRTGTTFIEDKRGHLYLVAADSDPGAAASRRLTDDDGSWGAPSWSPDGESLLATRERDPGAESLFMGRAIFRVPLDGGKPRQLVDAPFSYVANGPAGAANAPETSPDGRWIATLRFPEDRATSRNTRLAVFPAEGGEVRDLTLAVDRSAMTLHWAHDGTLWCGLEDHGDLGLYTVSLDGEATLIVGGTRIIDQFDAGVGGRLAFVAATPERPGELWVRDGDGTQRRLTDLHGALLAERAVITPEAIEYVAPDGLPVQGWVLYPRDFDPQGRAPLAVFIHGGPHTMWGPSFRSLWPDWQAAVGQGYVVFFCNPRGSEGYGQAFQEALHDGWGEADYQDILAGIDAVVARGGIDIERICVTGGSYGGFMTAWLLGHDTRFRAAAAQRGVYHLMSFYGTSDAYELIENEFDGIPWQEVDKLWRHSPLAYADRIETPLLILHADLDYRVPISDAEQLFAILRRRGKTVELVRYPREGHEMTRSGEPRHRVDHLTRILGWFARYAPPEP